MFTRDHRVSGKLELVQSVCFVIKLHEATQIYVVVDYVRDMTVKKSCKCGKGGSIEHLLFLYYMRNGAKGF